MWVKARRCRLLERFRCQDIERSCVTVEDDVGHAGPSGLVPVPPVDVPEAFNAVGRVTLLPTRKLPGVLA